MVVMGAFTIYHWLILVLFLIPVVHVLVSSRSHGGAKFGWFLATVFFSWLAYIVFLIVTQGRKDAQIL